MKGALIMNKRNFLTLLACSAFSLASAGAQSADAKAIVLYFSATGTTKAAAEAIGRLTGSPLAEIRPQEVYTDEDLNYHNRNCRANREMNDPASRPAMADFTADLSSCDTVFIGYPIWWGTMPRIINTFMDNHDLSGKVIMPFCTSGGSGISRSVADIRTAVPGADVRQGLRIRSSRDRDIEQWLRQNRIPQEER